MPTISELRDALDAARRLRDAADVDYIRAAQRVKGYEPAKADGSVLRRIKPDTSAAAVEDRDSKKLALARASKRVRAAERAVDAATLAAARPNGSTRAEAVYTPDAEHRFLRDLQAAWSNPAARERLERHQKVELERRDSGTVQGQGFLAPSFWSDVWADYPRVSAVVRSAIPEVPLPERGGIGYLPAFTEGSEAAILTYTSGKNDDAQVADSTPVTSDYVEAELVTTTAVWDVDRQVFERARPAGEASFGRDLLNAYDAALDDNLVNGDGSRGNHLGLLHVVGAGTADGSGGSTPQLQYQVLAGAAASMFDARHAMPTHLVLHPKRFLYLASGVTTAGAPLASAGGFPANGVGADPTWSAGAILGMRCLVTDRIGEDTVVLWRASDSVFGGTEAMFTFPQVQSSALAVRLNCYGLSQSFLHRLPSSVMLVSDLPDTGY
jgi:hypothetical protein